MRLKSILRDSLIVILIMLAMMAAIEGFVRLFMQERLETTYANGVPLAQEDPVLSYVNNPNASARVTGPEFTIDYQISEQGFRDPMLHPPDVAGGTTRILLIGDSYTYGHGVQYEDSWVARVRERFRQDGKAVDIINAGVPGYSTTQEVLYLKRLLPEYRPDIVVIGFVAHDLFTNRPIDESGAVAGIADAAVRSVGSDKKSSLHSVLLIKRLLASNDMLYAQAYARTGRRDWYTAPPSPWLADQIEITKGLLAEAADLTERQGAKLVVLSIPQLFQVLVEARGMAFDQVDVRHIDRTFADFAESERFAWVPSLTELAEHYRTRGEKLYFRLDGHFDEAGNAVFADIAYNTLAAMMADPSATATRAILHWKSPKRLSAAERKALL